MIARVGQRFARVTTHAVVRWPRAWRVFRAPTTRMFDRIASTWDRDRSPDAFAPLEAALAPLDANVRTALDLGTGTGGAALLVARRFPDAEVHGVDLASAMVEEARRKAPPGARLTFEVADAARLPYADGTFDLVTAANMIPFFDEVARVVAPGGHVVFSFSSGATTPIYVPPTRLRRELASRGFADFAEFAAGRGTALSARKQ